jgi:DNA helicase-2/ATP-dependent DNA helicase PcrA
MPGTRVRHAKYGDGTVIAQEGDGADARLTVSFPGFGRKKIVAQYCELKQQ